MKQITLEGSNVIFSFPFSWDTKEEVKRLGARFNSARKVWYLPMNKADRIEDLLSIDKDWNVDDKVAKLLRSASEGLDFHYCLDERLPDGRLLYAHQKEAVQWALSMLQSRYKGGILALDMGLGKTLVALVTAKIYSQAFPEVKILVICPAFLNKNWWKEANGVGINVEIYSWQKQPEVPSVSYLLIVDEAHYAQSGKKTQRGKHFLNLCQSAYCLGKLLLTGTPMKNGRPANLLPLLQAIDHPIVENRRYYEERYCAAKRTKYCAWDTSGASNLDELHRNVKDALFRRTKKECLDLPPKIRIMVTAEVTGQALDVYNRAKQQAILNYYENSYANGAPLVLMTALRKAASRAKVQHAVTMATELLEQEQQVVIFTEFLETAKELHQALGGCLLTGKTPVNQRQDLVDRFQAGQERVFISISGAGGVGITLTASQNVILVDRALTSGDVIQCEDRCHRIGTPTSVTCYWIQYDVIDERIDNLLTRKQSRIDLVLEGKRRTLRNTGGDPLDYIDEIAADLIREMDPQNQL